MSAFKEGEPTQVPNATGHGKYDDLLARVRALPNGAAIPLEFDELGKATGFANGMSSSFRLRGVRMQRRGNVVYLSKLEPKS